MTSHINALLYFIKKTLKKQFYKIYKLILVNN